MGIKAKLKVIGLLPLITALVFGLTSYGGRDRLTLLRDRTLLAEQMLDELRQLDGVSRQILDMRANEIRSQGYELLEALDAQLFALQRVAMDDALNERLDALGRRLVLTRIHFMNLDGLSVPALAQLDLPPARAVAERLQAAIRETEPLLQSLFHDSHSAAVTYSDGLWKIELALLAGTALLVILLTYPTLQRVGIAIQELSLETRTIGRGGLPRDLALGGTDEFARLAHDFDRMAHRLADAERAREQRTRELEDAVKDLENFSYSVSHDLRAPLRAIDGFIGILEEDYAASLDAEGRRLFGVVSSSAKKMEGLIDDILALSRAGRLELEPLEIDMSALVDEVWAVLSEQPREHRVCFRRSDLGGAVCDPRAIRQVWQNLLSNAIKFTRGRDPAVIEVDAERLPSSVRYTVKDNGAGFDPAFSNKLFGLFLRLHGVEEFEGSGVGLAIVKRFVERHRGQVDATGAVGAGAAFSFSLPIDPDVSQEGSGYGESRRSG